MNTTPTPEPTTCPECGADWNGVTCTEYFHELLSLDHQRVQPFGRFHGLNVACYLLQHPSKVPKGQQGQQDQLGPLWQMLTVYLSGGIEAVNDLERQLVAGSVPSFDAPATENIPVPERSRMPSITIQDVAAENPADPADPADPSRGRFPAAGYEDRIHLWVLSIAAERGLGAAA